MEIREQQHGAVKAISPQGPLCQADAAEFQKVASGMLSATMGRCVVDLTATPYLDSQGLESLLSLSETLSDSGQLLKLCGVCETVREILELTDLASSFEQFEDITTAVRSFL
ncbi:MAG: STAS domain-containing protein [Phycisphaeraceae bacterium]|nr:STAS domain-containing protein [Phycisphaeraceae bacterium]